MGQQLRFDDQVVVVTGGAGGLGRAHVLDLTRRGARVVVNDLGGSPLGGGADASLAEGVAGEVVAEGGEAIANGDTVATPEGARAIVEAALDTWGRLDALVANAGISNACHFENIGIDDWDEIIRVNLRGVFCTSQAAFRVMKAQGYGRIVTITSNAGLNGAYGMAGYSTTKAGLVGLTKSIAWEGLGCGVKANGVAPAAFDTRMSAAGLSQPDAMIGRPSEIEITGDLSYLPVVTSPRVTPIVVALAHELCPVSGQIFGGIGGHFSRYFTSQTEGCVPSLEATAEDVLDRWDDIVSPANAEELHEEMLIWLNRTGSEVLEQRNALG